MLTLCGRNDFRQGENVNLYVIICCFALFILINRRQNAKFFFEIFAEVFWIVIAELEGNFRDVQLALAQHLCPSFQADQADEFNRSLAGSGL